VGQVVVSFPFPLNKALLLLLTLKMSPTKKVIPVAEGENLLCNRILTQEQEGQEQQEQKEQEQEQNQEEA
jgi:hypothetical protein